MSFSIFLLIVYGVYYYAINYSVLIIHYVELNNKEKYVGVYKGKLCVYIDVYRAGL